jgi:lysophospholipase L1-like esterase
MKNVILIGDSIRMGYLPFVEKALEGEATVWGPYVNGGTSRNVLANLSEWVLERPADVVHLNCGLHDLARDPDENGRMDKVRVELDEYESNLRAIFSQVVDSGRKLIWATITPVNEENHRSKGFDRLEADVEKYNAAALRTGEEFQLPVTDLNRVVREAGPEKVLLPDGVHYTDEGSALLARAVVQLLRANL